MTEHQQTKIVRGHLLWVSTDGELLEIKDGGLAFADSGAIESVGDFASVKQDWPEARVIDRQGSVILPSFCDSHVHYPQLSMIGATAPSLLPWLHQHTFAAEQKFKGHHAAVRDKAEAFVAQLLRNGVSLAVVYSSSDAAATQVLFESFEAHGLRGIIGKTSMDRDCPEELSVSLAEDMANTEDLISQWHGHDGRLFYALTPRFAPSCSDTLMQALGQLYQANPQLYMQTHYAENEAEMALIKQLYPKAKHYLDVYDYFGILGPRTILAHGIHVSQEEIRILVERRCVISHCPTSNLFLGSGLCRVKHLSEKGVALALGTDVGAGTSFSLWKTMAEAYKVSQLLGVYTKVADFFALATLKSFAALGFGDLGYFAKGCQADFQVLNPHAKGNEANSWFAAARFDPLALRWQDCATAEERLAALIFLADNRHQQELWVRGRPLAHV